MAGYYAAKTKEISQREKAHMKEVRGAGRRVHDVT